MDAVREITDPAGGSSLERARDVALPSGRGVDPDEREGESRGGREGHPGGPRR